MSKITYLGKKTEGYAIGSCASLKEAIKESHYKKSYDTIYFNGNVHKLISQTGLKKVHDLVSIIITEAPP